MKKIWFFLLSVCFLVTAILTAPVAAIQFPDVNDHWASTYINSLAGAGYIKGYPDGTFGPDNPMTRAEFTTLLISCMSLTPGDSTTNSFSDISKHWGKKYINEAVEQGILIPDEYPTGLVPDGNIKRSEAAAMLVRALGEKPDTGALPPFTDLADVQKSMYKTYIKRAFDLKLLSGFPGGEFQPFTDMSRAQVAKVLTDFLTLYSGSAPATVPTVSGDIISVAIGEELYPLSQYPITFKFAYSSVPLSSITVNSDQITINGNYSFFTNSPLGNPDLIINNNLYTISKYTISNNILVAFPKSRIINSLEISGYKYNSEFVQLFVNSAYSDYYLADMKIIDEYKVEINGETYDLLEDRLTIILRDEFYDISKIDLSSADPLKLKETDRVIVDGMRLSDISAIFVDDKTLALDDIDEIEFLIDKKIYGLNKVVIDASGNFTASGETYDFDEVTMFINGQIYSIENIEFYRSKFIFYCTKGNNEDLALVNGKYYNVDEIEIVKGNTVYDLDDVLVISRNLVRIDGKRYEIDSTFYVRIDDTYYEISRIDYDQNLDIVIMKLTESDEPSIGNQPERIIFYVDDEKYQSGVDSDTKIYVDRTWIYFDEIIIVDPATFSYDDEYYDLIDAEISLDGDEFTVIDTSWTGSRQIFSLYME
ncbi:MAG: S-layer homology domain-containing protein [Syntrophomonadaceae bacterium]|nr:S-layer homology domain-containing protein [Syntrophomonadaceae bacterium]